MSFLSEISRLSIRATQFSLAFTGSMIREAQSALENVLDIKAADIVAPPFEGPPDLDHAVSDLANRMARIFYFTPRNPAALPGVLRNFADSAQASFRVVAAPGANLPGLMFLLPFSMSTMMAEVALRALEGIDAVGAPRYPEFIWYCVEIFSEFPVYITLGYRELIERQQKWVAEHPEDAVVRTDLGRALSKSGRFAEAAAELKRAAADDRSVRSTALHEAGVAEFFSGNYTDASRLGSAALAVNPENAPARYWSWLAAQRLGGYPAEIPAAHYMPIKTGYAEPSVRYEEIGEQCGLDKTSGGRGISIFDYNNDGLLDVAIVCAHGGTSLYRNNGDGTFTDVSVESGLYHGVNGFGCAAGDYDNSGYPSLCIVRHGFYGGMIELWHNNGDGTFTDVSVESGISGWAPSFTCSWVDYDRDGKLDLFICTNLGGLFDRKVQHKLFHNNGDGTFSDMAQKAGIFAPWGAVGHSWGDYDNDGFPDLFISNVIGRPQLFHNNGDGTFTDVTDAAGVDIHAVAFNAQFCDIDGDGWLDIVQYTWSIHEDQLYSMATGEKPEFGHPTRVYRNNRNGTFSVVSAELGLTECWGSMSGNAADINNDGYLDILLGNGGPLIDRNEPLVILENDGKRFRNVTFAAGLPLMGKGHGINCADLFGDGRQIIICATGGAYPGDVMTTSVFAPRERPGNYLAVLLTGTKSNRGAAGARLKLTAGGRQQHGVVNGGSNFGCLPPQQHFGLGKLETAEELEVWWPSGLRERFRDFPINTRIRIEEGEGCWRADSSAPAPLAALPKIEKRRKVNSKQAS